jgi:hypothetical protein
MSYMTALPLLDKDMQLWEPITSVTTHASMLFMLNLMMEVETVCETLDYNAIIIRLTTWEDFVKLGRDGSIYVQKISKFRSVPFKMYYCHHSITRS